MTNLTLITSWHPAKNFRYLPLLIKLKRVGEIEAERDSGVRRDGKFLRKFWVLRFIFLEISRKNDLEILKKFKKCII